jgi:tRNA(fMet)-specific endonuclease VapC
MYCLDANVVIAVLKGQPPRLLERFRRELAQNAIALPAITLFELQYGVAKSERRAENQDRLAIFLGAPIVVLPFDGEDAREAGEIRAALSKAGTPIGPYDLLIAAQARRRGAVLVTANAREFARVPRLRTEDWSLPQ